ncbi:AAA family ATPase [Actinophytocola sp. KF-1]
MPWRIFTGDGPTDGKEPWRDLPGPPPWRQRATAITKFVPTDDLVDAVNTALHLRRPLLLTGAPGSGKSTLLRLVAAELGLGDPLNWYITSRSTLQDGLYQYDALGRLHSTQVETEEHGRHVEDFVTLGPLGTALACDEKPRAVLIDEIDKSDFDLPGDLLNILEEGEFDIPPLVRDTRANQASGDDVYQVRGADRAMYIVPHGVVRRTHWPVIVMTSNGERTFPAPFLRRCVRFEMNTPSEPFLKQIVDAYLERVTEQDRDAITAFAQRLVAGERLAIDQLLNYLYLVTGESNVNVRLDDTVRTRLESTLLEELSGK